MPAFLGSSSRTLPTNASCATAASTASSSSRARASTRRTASPRSASKSRPFSKREASTTRSTRRRTTAPSRSPPTRRRDNSPKEARWPVRSCDVRVVTTVRGRPRTFSVCNVYVVSPRGPRLRRLGAPDSSYEARHRAPGFRGEVLSKALARLRVARIGGLVEAERRRDTPPARRAFVRAARPDDVVRAFEADSMAAGRKRDKVRGRIEADNAISAGRLSLLQGRLGLLRGRLGGGRGLLRRRGCSLRDREENLASVPHFQPHGP
mmetsp:Transcript_5751/g.18233  ORF Transcript_5751/g.18233 Transcript_5751/m.18233 type:complete len:265 (-) Transcript_5751:1410-2204(-)